ncbi:MAG: tetratricopeptide repeat protein [Candidatus Bathyarchaeia archaeon]
MEAEFDKELQSYFTDVEYLYELFKQWLTAPELPKRMLIIHGVGGIGKSSLLRMFRLHCKSVHVPVALASGDEQKSALDVLARWADDLIVEGIALLAFKKTREQYRVLYIRLENEAAKIAGKITKEAAKTLFETAASTIPGIGPLVSKLGGMGVEALTNWLFSRGFKKPDVDLLLDPTKKLTEDFLADIAKTAGKQRLVLMLDTFEQMEALSDWVCDVAQRLPPNVLLVIAGRDVPNWDRAWPGWMANAQVEELKPMTEENMRELIRRYYALICSGEPDPNQVDAIIAFARGLPMVATSAVQLWVKYGVKDFQVVKPQIVANLVDRLMEGVPKELVPALEAAAIVRWFDQPILRAVMKREDVRDLYNELRRFPFVRTRTEGLALHDTLRNIIDENLRVQDAERHRELHERAAAYFEKRLEKATSEEAEQLKLEWLYHCVNANEEIGISLFQETAESLTRYWLINRLHTLLNDASTYPLKRENSKLWRDYYSARLAQLKRQLSWAEGVYRAIVEKEDADPKLRAYAMCDLSELLLTTWTEQNVQEAKKFAQKSLDISRSGRVEMDVHLCQNYLNLATVYLYQGKWEQVVSQLDAAYSFFEQQKDAYGIVSVYISKKTAAANQGLWREFFLAHDRAKELYSHFFKETLPLKAKLLGQWARAWSLAGRFALSEELAKEALKISRSFQLSIEEIGALYDLGWALSFQNRFNEAQEHLLEAISLANSLGEEHIIRKALGFHMRGVALIREGKLQEADEDLRKALEIREKLRDFTPRAMQELYFWRGFLAELSDPGSAEFYYKEALKWYKYEIYYFTCATLAGLIRVKHKQGDCDAIQPLLVKAEQLAQRYEYNDHLASLRLTQGHAAWEGNAPTWENSFEAALHYYQQALIYALRYNRFLLDEVLSGRPQGTPLRPIIPECLKRGEEGRRMLIALRNWWQTDSNDIGAPCPYTISPVPQGIPLLEAERIARELEPGDGSPQLSVVEQIDKALKEAAEG